jgi:polysaccharide export outer membrane protein
LVAKLGIAAIALTFFSASVLPCTATPILQVSADRSPSSLIPEDPIDPNQPIRPGFQIFVTVVNEPEPAGRYTVDGGGNVLIHIAESQTPVNIQGETTAQAAATLTKFLKKFVRDPKVTVTITAVPRPIVYVSGAVRFTGPMQVNLTSTLVDVLHRCELLDTADLNKVRVTRRQQVGGMEKKRVMTLHVDAYLMPRHGKDADASQNPTLQDKDTIFVPFMDPAGNAGKPPITLYFSVEGGFRNAGRFPYLKEMTLTEAIIAAGGPAPYSKDRDGHILRPDPSNDPAKARIIKFSWPDLLKRKQPDIKIYPGDQIWIPPGTNGKKYSGFISTLTSTLSVPY